MRTRGRLAAIAAALTMLVAAPALALDLAGLTADKTLVLFKDTSPSKARTMSIEGVRGRLLGIDVRPANGELYGLGEEGSIYIIDKRTGAAKRVAWLSEKLATNDRAVVDFNPLADRMRVITSSGQNLRVNVDTGQTIIDRTIAFHPDDANKGKTPKVTAGAYINSYAGAKQTQLFDIDSALGAYLVQDPPNDGVLRTVGPTGVDAGSLILGLDIHTDKRDEYHGRAVIGATLHSVDVARGGMRRMGTVGHGIALIDLAILNKR